MRRGQSEPKPSWQDRRTQVIVAVIAFAVVGLLLWRLWPPSVTDPHEEASPASINTSSGTASTKPAATPAKQTPSDKGLSSDQRLAASLGCQTTPQAFTPTHVTITRPAVSKPMLQAMVVSVTAASSHGTMAPPLNQPWQVAWLAETAKPGATKGVANFTAHTYHAGQAIGNLLHDSNPLRAGDIITVSDNSGHAACYRFTKQVKFSVAAYQSTSTAFYDAAGTPEFRLMMCWDYQPTNNSWASRVVLYASALAH